MNLLTTTRIHISKALWLFSLLFVFQLSAQEDLSFLFVGDVMQHDGQIEAAYSKKTGSYEYADGFKFVRPIINQYDIRIANLEVTLAGKPYKGYPQFSSPDELAETLVSSGFNVILTANNHSCDRGSKGVIRTLDKLDELGVMHTGTFRNAEERDKNYPLMVNKNGYKVAILNYTYGTNGLTVKEPLIINYIDTAMIRKDIATAKERKADYIICNMHWGTEYKHLPTGYQKKYEQFCYDQGADMVIGGHPHVLQPIERKQIDGQDKLTVWSLGNFVSNMKVRYTRGGVMVGATIERDQDDINISAVDTWLVYVHKKQEGAVKHYYILPDYNYNQHRSDFLSQADLDKMNMFLSDSRKLFAEHNIGDISEKKVMDNKDVAALYDHYLGSYYSVLVKGASDDLLHNQSVKDYFHETVDATGENHILSGVFKTREQALGNLHFVQDLGVSTAPVLVLVKPNAVEILEE